MIIMAVVTEVTVTGDHRPHTIVVVGDTIDPGPVHIHPVSIQIHSSTNNHNFTFFLPVNEISRGRVHLIMISTIAFHCTEMNGSDSFLL